MKEFPALPGGPICYGSLLGCTEMEIAAERIMHEMLNVAPEPKPPDSPWEVPLSVGMFKDNDDALLGFVLLVANGWVESVYPPNWEFHVTPGFAERMRMGTERPCPCRWSSEERDRRFWSPPLDL